MSERGILSAEDLAAISARQVEAKKGPGTDEAPTTLIWDDVPDLVISHEALRALAVELADALIEQRHPSLSIGIRHACGGDADEALAKARAAGLLEADDAT